MSRSLFKVFSVCLLAAAATMASAQKVEAAVRFASVLIRNDTDIPLNYDYRWGSGAWSSKTLQPGEVWIHWWRFDRPNVPNNPGFFVRFDNDLTDAVQLIEYRLRVAHVADETSPTETNVFNYDGESRRYIDLFRNR